MAMRTDSTYQESQAPDVSALAITEEQQISSARNNHDLRVPPLLIVFYPGVEDIVAITADALGQNFVVLSERHEVATIPRDIVVAISIRSFVQQWSAKDDSRTTIVAHDIQTHQEAWDEAISRCCHFEYLYDHMALDRRDLVRYLAFVLGQHLPHDQLSQKEFTNVLATTFSDVSVALPNLEILTIGADAIELQVDCLYPGEQVNGTTTICSLESVGRQVMLLRQRTELPIIFTLRSTNDASDSTRDPDIARRYLYKALQWGCTYIDVELWLPRVMRQELHHEKGPSKIVSSFHDSSGSVKWSSDAARDLYWSSAELSDIVKMSIAGASLQDDVELDTFRDTMKRSDLSRLFSGINTDHANRASLISNKVFTPITHPLLRLSSGTEQFSAADKHKALHIRGDILSYDIYGIGPLSCNFRAAFLQKCCNELGLPHHLIPLEDRIDWRSLLQNVKFGGLYLDRPDSLDLHTDMNLSEAARAIGQFDTVWKQDAGSESRFVADNATWLGIRAMLVRHHTPSAYFDKPVLVLASSESDAGATMYALNTLATGIIYTVGFRCGAWLNARTRQMTDVEDLTESEQPFAIVNVLPASKSNLVKSLLWHYGWISVGRQIQSRGVYIDLTDADPGLDHADETSKTSRALAATSSGWIAHDCDDTRAWTTMEMIRMLVGQNVPHEFVRLACGAKSF